MRGHLLIPILVLAGSACQTVDAKDPSAIKEAHRTINVNMPPLGLPGLDGDWVFETVPAEYEKITTNAMVNNASVEYVPRPPNFETVTEIVTIEPEYNDYAPMAERSEWVAGEIPGETTILEYVPAELEEIVEKRLTIPATIKLKRHEPICDREEDGSFTIIQPATFTEEVEPAVTEEYIQRRVKTSAFVREKSVPNIIKDGKTKIALSPLEVSIVKVPAVTQQMARRVVKITGPSMERTLPAGERELTCRILKTPEHYIIRDREGVIVQRFDTPEAFEAFRHKHQKANP